MTSNTPMKNLRPHTTHYACAERLAEYGGKTVGCCCTGHICKDLTMVASDAPRPGDGVTSGRQSLLV